MNESDTDTGLEESGQPEEETPDESAPEKDGELAAEGAGEEIPWTPPSEEEHRVLLEIKEKADSLVEELLTVVVIDLQALTLEVRAEVTAALGPLVPLQPHPPQILAGSGGVIALEKPSARTRVSMEMATSQLGGHPVTVRNEEVGVSLIS